MDWKALPPLCRPDDAKKKNQEIARLRQTSLSAEEPGDTATEPSCGESFVDPGEEAHASSSPDWDE